MKGALCWCGMRHLYREWLCFEVFVDYILFIYVICF